MTVRFIALLLICQLIGETVQVATGLSVPGPLIGMAILFMELLLRHDFPNGNSHATAWPWIYPPRRSRINPPDLTEVWVYLSHKPYSRLRLNLLLRPLRWGLPSN